MFRQSLKAIAAAWSVLFASAFTAGAGIRFLFSLFLMLAVFPPVYAQESIDLKWACGASFPPPAEWDVYGADCYAYCAAPGYAPKIISSDEYHCRVFARHITDEEAHAKCVKMASKTVSASCANVTLEQTDPIDPSGQLEMVVPAGSLFTARPEKDCWVSEWTGACAWVPPVLEVFSGIPNFLGPPWTCRPQGTGQVTVGVIFECDQQ